MSFTQKEMRFTFSGAPTGNFSAAGFRALASIQQYAGPLGVQAQVKIWGLSMGEMNRFSSAVPSAIKAELPKASLIIEAGDLGQPLKKVINAPIFQSFIDLSGAPDSAFVVSVAGIAAAANTNSAQSWQGTWNAEDLIESLCVSGSFKFQNNGAHSVIRNPSLPADSALNQIADLASQANFQWSWGLGNTLNIWPQNGTVDSVVIEVGPKTDPQMVGYPSYWPLGLIVTSLWNSEIQVGRKMNIVGSSIPKANSTWAIVNVRHELTTMHAKGPWFTTAVLAPIGM